MPSQLLIAYESGVMCLWDMRGKMAEMRWQSAQPLRSISWHYEGKHFASSHTDGSLCTWPLRPTPMPLYHNYPHGKLLLLWCMLCRRRRNPDDDASLSRLLGLNYYVINRHFVGTLINNLNTPYHLSLACPACGFSRPPCSENQQGGQTGVVQADPQG